MTRNEFLRRIEQINVGRSIGRRAPHKPLLLLLALRRVLSGKEQFVEYRELERPLRELLRSFGTPTRTLHPEQPFGRLCNDGLWEISCSENLSRTDSDDYLVGELRSHNVRGGFPEDVYGFLLPRPEVVLDAVHNLLQTHFPPSLHSEIRNMVGLPQWWKVQDRLGLPHRLGLPRDPKFRGNVLREYEGRCAVCDFDVRLGNELIGLEAAHIMWHSHGGPDVVSNGLALCGLHHKALDKGALGLEPTASGFQILISCEIAGLTPPIRWFTDYHRKRLRLPRNPDLFPAREYVHWHKRQVFRSPSLP